MPKRHRAPHQIRYCTPPPASPPLPSPIHIALKLQHLHHSTQIVDQGDDQEARGSQKALPTRLPISTGLCNQQKPNTLSYSKKIHTDTVSCVVSPGQPQIPAAVPIAARTPPVRNHSPHRRPAPAVRRIVRIILTIRVKARFFAAVLLCACLRDAQALDPHKTLTQYSRKVWTQEHGLPQDTIRAITQTADGYLWLGTDEGLARFDGYEERSL